MVYGNLSEEHFIQSYRIFNAESVFTPVYPRDYKFIEFPSAVSPDCCNAYFTVNPYAVSHLRRVDIGVVAPNAADILSARDIAQGVNRFYSTDLQLVIGIGSEEVVVDVAAGGYHTVLASGVAVKLAIPVGPNVPFGNQSYSIGRQFDQAQRLYELPQLFDENIIVDDLVYMRISCSQIAPIGTKTSRCTRIYTPLGSDVEISGQPALPGVWRIPNRARTAYFWTGDGTSIPFGFFRDPTLFSAAVTFPPVQTQYVIPGYARYVSFDPELEVSSITAVWELDL